MPAPRRDRPVRPDASDQIVLGDDVPAGARVVEQPAVHDGLAVHQPLGRQAVVALQQDVGLAVAVEVAGAGEAPTGGSWEGR
jgi:hypothetical protein